MAHVNVKWLQGRQFVGIDSSKHAIVVSSQDEANGVGMRPNELLLIALATCVCVDVVEVIGKKRMQLHSLDVSVDGQQEQDPPWPFRKIHLVFHLRGEGLTPKAVEETISMIEEKYCSVSATVRGVAEVTWEAVVD
jgi:putative redox protein